MKTKPSKLLFVVNPASGHGKIDFVAEIEAYFKRRKILTEIYILPEPCDSKAVKKVIKDAAADRVIAVGGDGTLKLIASCLLSLKADTPIGIIPAGSANGMAKELGIPADTHKALDIVLHSEPLKIHVIRINGEICIHLSDIGFNAYLVKKFDELPERGMKTYVKAAWQAFWNRRKMEVRFRIGNQHIHAKAAMVVLANATKYGTGLQINPNGLLNDHLFEVILIKSYAILEILKIWMSRLPWNPKKIECYQVDKLTIRTRHKVHFQVDGEYLGKTNRVEAQLLPASLNLLMPSTSGVPVP